jgi:hypothetical protein
VFLPWLAKVAGVSSAAAIDIPCDLTEPELTVGLGLLIRSSVVVKTDDVDCLSGLAKLPLLGLLDGLAACSVASLNRLAISSASSISAAIRLAWASLSSSIRLASAAPSSLDADVGERRGLLGLSA